MMELFSKLTPLIQKSSKLNINELNIVSKEREDGVVIQMTSPNPDGKKMANTFAEVFTALAEMLGSQGVKINSAHLDIEGNELRRA